MMCIDKTGHQQMAGQAQTWQSRVTDGYLFYRANIAEATFFNQDSVSADRSLGQQEVFGFQNAGLSQVVGLE